VNLLLRPDRELALEFRNARLGGLCSLFKAPHFVVQFISNALHRCVIPVSIGREPSDLFFRRTKSINSGSLQREHHRFPLRPLFRERGLGTFGTLQKL